MYSTHCSTTPGRPPMAMSCPECDGTGVLQDPPIGTKVRSLRFKLERGWRKQWLIGKLARSEGSQSDLAAACEVTQPAIVAFAKRHRAEIEKTRTRLEGEVEGLWIADKLN